MTSGGLRQAVVGNMINNLHYVIAFTSLMSGQSHMTHRISNLE